VSETLRAEINSGEGEKGQSRIGWEEGMEWESVLREGIMKLEASAAPTATRGPGRRRKRGRGDGV